MPPIAPWMRPLPWGAAPPQHRQARQGGASGIQHISSSLPATSLEQQEATANTLEHRSEKLVQYNYVVHQKNIHKINAIMSSSLPLPTGSNFDQLWHPKSLKAPRHQVHRQLGTAWHLPQSLWQQHRSAISPPLVGRGHQGVQRRSAGGSS